MITIADGSTIHNVDFTPNIINGFFWFQRELREVRDIHYNKNGVQYELYPLFESPFSLPRMQRLY
jgi:hypothetical protein